MCKNPANKQVRTEKGTIKKKSIPRISTQGRVRANECIQCWAHKRSGFRCLSMVESREGEPIPIPYCEAHLKSGDAAVKVVSHPFAGKTLVANWALPKDYRMVFWGYRGKCPTSNKEDRSISYYPPNRKTGRNLIPHTRTLKTDNYNGVLNPKGTGDILQYAACPGPSERQNMRSTFQYFGLRNGNVGGLEFITLEEIPKNTQLCHWYGKGWWSARGIKRQDVATEKYPAPKRRSLNQLDALTKSSNKSKVF